MLPEEYNPGRQLPQHLRPPAPAEDKFLFNVRSASIEDLAEIAEIYNYYVTNSVVTFDETRKSRRVWVSKLTYSEKHSMPFIVAEAPSGQILGYAMVTPWRQKRAFRFTVELSIYLGPAATQKGLGKVLLSELIEQCRQNGIKEMIAVISDQGAEASMRLHQSLGFVEVGRMGRVGFKFNRWLGTVLLQKRL